MLYRPTLICANSVQFVFNFVLLFQGFVRPFCVQVFTQTIQFCPLYVFVIKKNSNQYNLRFSKKTKIILFYYLRVFHIVL